MLFRSAYKVNGKETRQLPFDIDRVEIEPVYVTLPGWKTDMTSMQDESEFPAQFKEYIAFLEKELDTPIYIVSTGPDRRQTIFLNR